MPPTAVIIGEAMIELQSSADEPGVSHGSGESFGSGVSHRTFAGDTLNCTVEIAAVSTDISVRYLTGVGEGEQSSQFIDFCASLRVDASGSMRVPDRQLGVYWIETGDTEQRFRHQRDKSADGG